MPLKLYGNALSPYVHAVQITLVEKGLDYDLVPMGPQELQAPDYTALHPFRRIPSLSVDGEPLFETSAIMRFLDEAYPDGKALQPSDPLSRARSEQWMSAGNSYLYPDLFTGLVFQRAIAPQFGLPVDEGRISECAEKAVRHLEIISEALEQKTLGSEVLTLGDIYVGAILHPLPTIPEGQEALKTAPKVAAWIEELSSRDSFSSTVAK